MSASMTIEPRLVDPTTKSLSLLCDFDFENGKTNQLALAVFEKKGKSFLKVVNTSNKLKRWWYKDNRTKMLDFIKAQIQFDQDQGNTHRWLNRDNLKLKKQYAVISMLYDFQNPLKETLEVKLKYPIVDKDSSVINPSYRKTTVITFEYDEMTETDSLAQRVSDHLRVITTKSYGKEFDFPRNCFHMKKEDKQLCRDLKDTEKSLADFLLGRSCENVLKFLIKSFNIKNLESHLRGDGNRDGYDAGYQKGRDGKDRPFVPDISEKDAAQDSFALDAYYKAYSTAFYQGFDAGMKDMERYATRRRSSSELIHYTVPKYGDSQVDISAMMNTILLHHNLR